MKSCNSTTLKIYEPEIMNKLFKCTNKCTNNTTLHSGAITPTKVKMPQQGQDEPKMQSCLLCLLNTFLKMQMRP